MSKVQLTKALVAAHRFIEQHYGQWLDKFFVKRYGRRASHSPEKQAEILQEVDKVCVYLAYVGCCMIAGHGKSTAELARLGGSMGPIAAMFRSYLQCDPIEGQRILFADPQCASYAVALIGAFCRAMAAMEQALRMTVDKFIEQQEMSAEEGKSLLDELGPMGPSIGWSLPFNLLLQALNNPSYSERIELLARQVYRLACPERKAYFILWRVASGTMGKPLIEPLFDDAQTDVSEFTEYGDGHISDSAPDSN